MVVVASLFFKLAVPIMVDILYTKQIYKIYLISCRFVLANIFLILHVLNNLIITNIYIFFSFANLEVKAVDIELSISLSSRCKLGLIRTQRQCIPLIMAAH